jgi:hypothetical protein
VLRNVPLSGYIVNRVIPESPARQQIPDYLHHRLEMQRLYVWIEPLKKKTVPRSSGVRESTC